MTWANLDELQIALGLGIAAGLLVGAVIALFNSWRA